MQKMQKKALPISPSSASSSFSLMSLRVKAHRVSPYLLFTFLVFIEFVAILYGENFMLMVKRSQKLAFAVGKTEESCNLFSGRWVWDQTRPLYEESNYPYIQPQLMCQEHGRPDTGYRQWRWQPYGCDHPKFNASMMLETLRGKRMMFVGDSLNRGQFLSLVCLLHQLIPEDAKSMETFDSLIVFTAKEYNVTIEFYWAAFLLESNSDSAVSHRIVRKDSINKHGRNWKGVEILVFNTYHWWVIGLKMKILLGSFDDEVKDIMELSTEDAYRMAMKSMLRWVRLNMDPKKTRVFFTSMSPSHGNSLGMSPLTSEQLANPVSYADCVHWCLPGLQDTWNELLFAKLFYP